MRPSYKMKKGKWKWAYGMKKTVSPAMNLEDT